MMKAIARYPNVHCKVSGMITEANWESWSYDELEPYLDVVFSAFGVERIMFGSDWPVCLVAGTYEQVVELVERYTSHLSTDQKAAVFGNNGAAFYGISNR